MKQAESLDTGLLDAEQVGKLLRLEIGTVYKMAREGHLPRIVISRRAVRFDRQAIQQFLKECAA